MMLTPVASAFDPLSSQTKTHPEVIVRRSSVSRRRETMGSMLRETAWNMACASAGDRTRRPVQVGRCMTADGWESGGRAGRGRCCIRSRMGMRSTAQLWTKERAVPPRISLYRWTGMISRKMLAKS